MAELPAGTEMVMPGDNVSLVIELITPVAMEKGLRFAIREGGHTVGAGTIAKDCAVAKNRVERGFPRRHIENDSNHNSRLAACRQFFPLGTETSREGQRE
jgi:hypothetical protein